MLSIVFWYQFGFPITRRALKVRRARCNNDFNFSNAIALSTGNYLLSTPSWDCTVAIGCAGTIADAGALTWGSGTSGVSGPIDTSKSLVGSAASDGVGIGPVGLSNGNYVHYMTLWDCTVAAGCSGAIADVGAVTWGSGSLAGNITRSNSVTGSSANDNVGGVLALSSGNYILKSSAWNAGEGIHLVLPGGVSVTGAL